MALTLTADERAELERRVRSLKIRSEDARRARVILMLAEWRLVLGDRGGGAVLPRLHQPMATPVPG